MYRHLLIPVDGSSASKTGLREVVQIASPGVSRIRLVHVIDSSAGRDSYNPRTVGDTLIQASRDNGTVILAEAREVLAKHGLHAECILIESHGERGRRGLAPAVMGSEAAEVFRESPIPVLLVRAVYP
jgi:nucleotide-binding universal stress UspA family protein